MKSAYYPLTDKTNKYVKIIVKCISKNNIEVKGAKLNDSMDYEIINLNWYESIFKKNYIKAIIEYYNKVKFINKLKRKGVKIIWTVHNKIPHDGKYTYFAKKLMKLLLIKSDQIVIHCNETINVLKELDTSIDIEKKTNYIPHPNYIGVYEEKEINYREQLGLKDEIVFLFAGQIRPYKNVELIIKAAKEIKDSKVRFIIAGNPSSKIYKRELENLIGNQENIITMFKYIEDDELVPLIKAADILILPYDLKSSLNSGVAILAFTYGKTLICPEIGTLKDFDNTELFYSYTYSTEEEHERELNNKIQECYLNTLENKNILKEKGIKLQSIVLDQYSRDIVSKKYKELYNKILGR